MMVIMMKLRSKFPGRVHAFYTATSHRHTVQVSYRGPLRKADHAFHQEGSSEVQAAAEVYSRCHSDRISPERKLVAVPALTTHVFVSSIVTFKPCFKH